ncbi:helix-turn-helix domain-containing protein [Weissella kandleri]|nr:helix-turn-helix transcriptional regulator [Weissella kandleri]
MEYKSLSLALKNWRLTHRLSLSDVETMTGISKSAISNYESRLRTPDLKNAKKLSDVLMVPMSDILEMSEYDRNKQK